MTRDWKHARNPFDMPAGTYLVALTRGAWKVPVLLSRENGVSRLTVNGEDAGRSWSQEEVDQEVCDWLTAVDVTVMAKLIMFGEACTAAEYHHRLAVKQWAEAHCPDHPCLSPTRPMNRSLLSLPTF